MKTLTGLLPLAVVLLVVGGLVWWLLDRGSAVGPWLVAAILFAHGWVHIVFLLVISRSDTSLPTLSRDGRGEQRSRPSASKSHVDVFHEQYAMQVVGWRRFEPWYEIQVEIARLGRLADSSWTAGRVDNSVILRSALVAGDIGS